MGHFLLSLEFSVLKKKNCSFLKPTVLICGIKHNLNTPMNGIVEILYVHMMYVNRVSQDIQTSLLKTNIKNELRNTFFQFPLVTWSRTDFGYPKAEEHRCLKITVLLAAWQCFSHQIYVAKNFYALQKMYLL